MNIANNIRKIKAEIPDNVTIIGVTKYVDVTVAEELCQNGIMNLGENRVDVLVEKYNSIKTKPVWHFIGTLQTRKVKDVIDKIDYLHSLDRLSLADEIQKRSDKRVKCFVQVNVTGENSKHGLPPDKVMDFISQLADHDKIEIVGLMTMAPDTDDDLIIQSCFASLKRLQKKVQEKVLKQAPCTELSMGMTNDYKIAIREGATFVRLGRCLIKGIHF